MSLIAGKNYYVMYSHVFLRLQIFELDCFTDEEFETINESLRKFGGGERSCCNQITCIKYPKNKIGNIYLLKPKENISIEKVLIFEYEDGRGEIFINEKAQKYYEERKGEFSPLDDSYHLMDNLFDLYYFDIIFNRCFSNHIHMIEEIIDKCNNLKSQKIVTTTPSNYRAYWYKWKVYTYSGKEFEHKISNIPVPDHYLSENLRDHGANLDCIKVFGYISEKKGEYSFMACPILLQPDNFEYSFTFCPYIVSEKVDAEMFESSNEVIASLIQTPPKFYALHSVFE